MSASKFLLCAAVGWLCCSSIRSLVPSSTPQCQPMPPVAVSSHHATDLSSWNSLKVSLCLCLSLCVSVSSVSLSVSVFSLLCIYPSINTLTHPSIHPPTHIMYIHPSNHGALTLTSINRSAMAHTHTHLYINPFAFLTAIQRPLASLPQASSRNQGTIKLSWKHNNVVLYDKQTHRAKTPAIRSDAVSRFLRIIQFSILCMAQPSRNTE